MSNIFQMPRVTLQQNGNTSRNNVVERWLHGQQPFSTTSEEPHLQFVAHSDGHSMNDPEDWDQYSISFSMPSSMPSLAPTPDSAEDLHSVASSMPSLETVPPPTTSSLPSMDPVPSDQTPLNLPEEPEVNTAEQLTQANPPSSNSQNTLTPNFQQYFTFANPLMSSPYYPLQAEFDFDEYTSDESVYSIPTSWTGPPPTQSSSTPQTGPQHFPTPEATPQLPLLDTENTDDTEDTSSVDTLPWVTLYPQRQADAVTEDLQLNRLHVHISEDGLKVTYHRFIVGHNLSVTKPIHIARPFPQDN